MSSNQIVVAPLVTKLPQASFDKLEKAAVSHKPERGLDPSKDWGVDIFE
jgi:hypothetical protein